VRKIGSCGDAVFVDEAAKSVAAPSTRTGNRRNGIAKPLPEELFVELLCLRAWGDAKIGA